MPKGQKPFDQVNLARFVIACLPFVILTLLILWVSKMWSRKKDGGTPRSVVMDMTAQLQMTKLPSA
jgi:hypothetical protein